MNKEKLTDKLSSNENGCKKSLDNDASSLSGKNDNHDSIFVIFQKIQHDDKIQSKGLVSDMNIDIIGRKHLEELDCQNLTPFLINSKKMVIPPDFKSEKLVHDVVMQLSKL